MSWDSKVQNLLGHCTSSAAFGGDVIHSPAVGADQTIEAIWSDVYISVETSDGATAMSDDPNIGVRLSDFGTKPKRNDTITRAGVEYFIRALEPDGEGGSTLVLEKKV